MSGSSRLRGSTGRINDLLDASEDGPVIDTVLPVPPYEPPYTGDEPLGTCLIHGDYWTDDCLRCGR